MGQRQKRLAELLLIGGATFVDNHHRRPALTDIRDTFLEPHVMKVYKSLGGLESLPKVSPGAWDLILDCGVVELDEELHFNRYRLQTLQSPLYDRLHNFPTSVYSAFSMQFEAACFSSGKFGGKWTNASAEVQFGFADSRPCVHTMMSPRWKQRAFYDFINDLTPMVLRFNLSRISVWDSVVFSNMKRSVRDVLMANLSLEESQGWGRTLLTLVTSRMAFA